MDAQPLSVTAPARHPRVASLLFRGRVSTIARFAAIATATIGFLGFITPPGHAADAPHAGSPAAPSGAGGLVHTLLAKHPAAHLGFPSGRAVSRASSTWYTQEGMTMDQVNGTSTITAVPALFESFLVARSPYSTGFELNGLTASGDWFQVVVSDNWPGCPGFQMVTEVWDSSQNSGPVNCDSTVTLAAGDVVQLELNFTATRGVCLNLKDVTTEVGRITCQAQPNSGAAEFSLLNSQANGNGFYSGPMTEVVNLTASACPDYTLMPLVSYEFPRALGLTTYIPWSDEFALGGSACYVSSLGAVTLGALDFTSHYANPASGSVYGPRYSAGQNDSLLVNGAGFRYQTDVIPITAVQLTASTTDPTVGQTVLLSTSGTGGVAPYGAVWLLNGSVQPAPRTATWGWVVPGGGSYDFASYLSDTNRDIFGPTGDVLVTVQGALSVGPLYGSPVSGAVDAGQNITFVAQASGGVGSRSYQWSGLPTGCFTSDTSVLQCTPVSAGSFSVSVTVTDANGSKVVSPRLAYLVMSDPLASLRLSTSTLDAGQTFILTTSVVGGAGSDHYNWNGLPGDCTVGDLSALSCQSFLTGSYSPSVSVTDRNGFATQAGSSVVVHGDPTIQASVSRTLVDAGQRVSLSASVTAGTPSFHYVWSSLPAGCLSNDSPNLACSPTGVGTALVTVTATDAVGISASSGVLVLAVAKSPTVSLSAAPAVLSVGSSALLTAIVSGGTATYTFSWSGLPAGCAAANRSAVTCDPTSPGAYAVSVFVTDSAGVQVSASSIVVVNQAPSNGLGPGGWNGFLGFGPTVSMLVLLGIGCEAALLVALMLRRRAPPPL